MADPRWKNLRDVQSDVVQLLSSLLSGPLLDKLQTKDLLTDDNYESVRRKKKNDGDIEAARDLITLLKKTPTPAYESFCEALREVDGGETVLRKLQGPAREAVSDSRHGTTGVGVKTSVGSKKVIASGSQNPADSDSAAAATVPKAHRSEPGSEVIVIEHLPSSRPEIAYLCVNEEKVKLKQIERNADFITDKGGNLTLEDSNMSVEVPSGAIGKLGCSVEVAMFVAESTVYITNSAMELKEAAASVTLIELSPHRRDFAEEITIEQQLSPHETTDNACCIETQFLFYYWGGDTADAKYEHMGTTNSSDHRFSYNNKTISIEAMDQAENSARAAAAGVEVKRQRCLIRSKSFCRICRIKISHSFSNTLMIFEKQDFSLRSPVVLLEAFLTCQCKASVRKIENEEKEKHFVPIIDHWQFFMENRERLDSSRRLISITLSPTSMPSLNLQGNLNFSGSNVVKIQLSNVSTFTNKTAMIKGIRSDGETLVVNLQAHCALDGDENNFFFVVRPMESGYVTAQELPEGSGRGHGPPEPDSPSPGPDPPGPDPPGPDPPGPDPPGPDPPGRARYGGFEHGQPERGRGHPGRGRGHPGGGQSGHRRTSNESLKLTGTPKAKGVDKSFAYADNDGAVLDDDDLEKRPSLARLTSEELEQLTIYLNSFRHDFEIVSSAIKVESSRIFSATKHLVLSNDAAAEKFSYESSRSLESESKIR
ncbi:uncharacterized protein [Oscarella lobularis]|uniref:uncharacterized protein isoform X3 n=1 Tax=Oscarella lobularis TaxID=121494 RepID=UPI0033137B68